MINRGAYFADNVDRLNTGSGELTRRPGVNDREEWRRSGGNIYSCEVDFVGHCAPLNASANLTMFGSTLDI